MYPTVYEQYSMARRAWTMSQQHLALLAGTTQSVIAQVGLKLYNAR